MKKSIFVLTATLIFAFNGGVSAQKDDAFARKLIADYDNAWNKKEATKVAEILADDYVYFTSTGRLSSRKQSLDMLTSPKYNLTFAERSEINVQHSDRNSIIVSSRWKGRGTYDKEEINDDQRCGLVFIKTGKRWRLHSEHCVQIVSK